MSESSLSFVNSSSFRNNLINKNLPPYTVQGTFTPPSGPTNYETNLTVSEVIDSPDELISNGPFVQQLYPLNEYGPEGGYNLQITYNGPLLPVEPNKGEYDPNDTVLDLVNEFYIDASFIENKYGPEGGFNQLVIIDSIQNNDKIYLPYWDPPTFRPSSYTPYQILLSDNPTGSDGTLSQDSYLARLGAQTLKKLFQDRIDAEIYQNTVGLVNLESLSDPFEASLLATGQEPLIYRNYRITVPENPLLAAADFLTRIAGAYWPVSPIPGDYFNENISSGAQTQQTSTALNVINQLTGGFLGPILNITRNPSEIFLSNTGNGQRSVLFRNLSYNRYQPSYSKNFGGILGIGQGVVNLAVNLINPNNGTLVGGYYVGSRNAEPSTITSPPNQIPVNAYGQQDPVPVYGPSELGILFEGNQEKINFGLKGKSLTDGGGIDGQFVWVSPKYKGNAGFKPTPGGGAGSIDEEFNIISSSYQSNESTNIDFKDNSILDQTQRLIDAADNVSGIARLKHVGNAINQVSKVFNDGYKEMTKGSQILSYTDNTTGGEAGIEYCRVFAKDTPYYTYADLQKTDGITTSGRRFTNSVLDNTYNLNIAPLKNPGSTNIIPDNEVGLGGYAKKYMFSIENLAWRTSSRPGYTYDELPTCEKGPNGGRVMWFPPYNIKFSDTSTAMWNPVSFMGRPEPIYTYKDTNRSGSLSWQIIVDHPSVMNTLIEKQLKGQTKERINSIIDSFFAGCVKYDIYELAKKFNTIPVKDLFTYQEILNNPRLTDEELAGINRTIPKENTPINPSESQNTNEQNKNNEDTSIAEYQKKYVDFAFYFDNDIPGPSTGSISNADYETTYNNYIGKKQTYIDKAKAIFNTGDREANVSEFFDVIQGNFNEFDNKFITDSFDILKEGGTITIEMQGSASAAASQDYNQKLSERRIDSVTKFFRSKMVGDANLAKFIDDKKFIIKSFAEGETSVLPASPPTGFTGDSQTGFQVNCTEPVSDKNGNITSDSKIYSVSAMACRRVRVKNLIATIPPPKGNIEEPPKTIVVNNPVTQPQPTVDYLKKVKEGISKKILRNLFSECDYFEIIKETNPMILDTIKEKIKYFSPTFHSMTPEGLNARLTFLNQCVRPGETIPTIGTDGKPKFNDAVNTSFGAPPVLVLRIGDFYHTKIIPDTISFSYEPLVFDMNPEGIGVQPMIVNVNLGFKIIGGMGLAKPVEQLQNALSFNFYANTEIYDERAVWTEDTSALDKKLVDAILASQTPATVNNVDNTSTNNGGSTIGEIITNIPVPSGQTGETSYMKVMDKFLDQTRGYFELITNKLESINASYNYGVVQLLDVKRNYSEGNLQADVNSPSVPIKIYGKPSEWEKTMDNQINLSITNITNNSNPIISKLGDFYNSKFDESPLREVKDNMIKYIQNLGGDIKNGISTTLQEIVIGQQDYVQNIRKINLIVDKIDGKILDTNVARVYNLSGLTSPDTYLELKEDYLTLITATTQFNELLSNKDFPIAFYGTSFNNGDFKVYNENGIKSIEEKNFYLLMARILTDKNKKIDFINSVIKTTIPNQNKPVNLKNKFEKIVDDLQKEYDKELKEETKNFEKLKKNTQYKKLTEGIIGVMYERGKTRKFNYSTVAQSTQAERDKIQNLYKSGNVDENPNTFNGKVKFN